MGLLSFIGNISSCLGYKYSFQIYSLSRSVSFRGQEFELQEFKIFIRNYFLTTQSVRGKVIRRLTVWIANQSIRYFRFVSLDLMHLVEQLQLLEPYFLCSFSTSSYTEMYIKIIIFDAKAQIN